MLKRRLASITAAAIMIGSAPVLSALTAASASPATTAAAVSSRPTAAANTACVYIQDHTNDAEIEGGGVNNPITETTPPGSCFTLHYKFTTPCGAATVCTGYEYQDLSGHCLWDNHGTIDVGLACGGPGHPNEQFFGVRYIRGCGWLVADITEGYGVTMNGGALGATVTMVSGVGSCWNYPS
jgi:hypothetical protein